VTGEVGSLGLCTIAGVGLAVLPVDLEIRARVGRPCLLPAGLQQGSPIDGPVSHTVALVLISNRGPLGVRHA